MQTKTRAIVLRTIKYGDSRVIADLLTESNGRLSFAVRIPKTQKGHLKKQFFQPLTLLDIVFDYRQRTTLQHLRDAHLSQPFTDIPFSAAKLSISLFIAEFLYYATRGEQQNQPLFAYVAQSIRWLDACNHSFANFHLVFMMRLSRFLGFMPNLDNYAAGCYFDLRSASFVGMAPLHPDFLLPAEAERVTTLMRMGYESMHLFRLSRADRNRIAETILLYYRFHLPQMPDLQSFSVLQELFV